MADETGFEGKYMQLQMIQQQAQQITEYVERLQGQQKELDHTLEALTQLQKITLDTEILAPIANGIFLKAALKDNQKLVVNVGAEVTVEKNIPEILKLLAEQKKMITGNITEAETILQQLQEQGKKLYQESSEAAE